MIDRVLNTGSGLIANKHFAAPDIKHKMDELSNDWDELMMQAANRRNKLDASMAKHTVRFWYDYLWQQTTILTLTLPPNHNPNSHRNPKHNPIPWVTYCSLL